MLFLDKILMTLCQSQLFDDPALLMFCADLLPKHINYRNLFLFFVIYVSMIYVSMMSSFLLPVWPGDVHFWLIGWSVG